MNRTFLLKATAVATLTLAGVAAPASSAQAQNVINFTGSANVRDEAPGGGGAFLLVDFLTGGAAGYGAPGTVTTIRDTDLPGVGLGETGLLKDLRASQQGFTDLPVASFLTVGGYTFTLSGGDLGSTFGPITLVEAGPNTLATFNVNGMVTGGAFGSAQTAFNGVFTTQFVNVKPNDLFNRINQGGTENASFSATLAVAAVPEPSTYALLATGIAGLGAVARRRRQSA
jgi:hypothetical protein